MFSKETIAAFGARKTPFYFYDLALLDDTLSACKKAADQYGFHVHYAMKANFNHEVLKAIQAQGFGADCVSGNEVKKAIEVGFPADKVVFAGVGKSDDEIIAALQFDIFCFNVESVQELCVISELAGKVGKTARVALRINPNVDAYTHHNITTGLEENKFGINQWELPACAEYLNTAEHLWLEGIHFHIGSQITNLTVFKSLCIRVNEIKTWFEERGFNLRVLNVGGGLGVDYMEPDQNNIANFSGYFEIFNQFLDRKLGQEVHFELGRALVAHCGSLISRVLYVKNGIKKHFLVLDAGMTELMRPALYQAYHKIENLTRGDIKEHDQKYDIVGPICESTDCFGKEVQLGESFRGDLIAIRTAGAYGDVMSSRYNLREQSEPFYLRKS